MIETKHIPLTVCQPCRCQLAPQALSHRCLWSLPCQVCSEACLQCWLNLLPCASVWARVDTGRSTRMYGACAARVGSACRRSQGPVRCRARRQAMSCRARVWRRGNIDALSASIVRRDGVLQETCWKLFSRVSAQARPFGRHMGIRVLTSHSFHTWCLW